MVIENYIVCLTAPKNTSNTAVRVDSRNHFFGDLRVHPSMTIGSNGNGRVRLLRRAAERVAVAPPARGRGRAVISKRAKDDLVSDYMRAANLVDRAASILEDASVMISSAGEEFTFRSAKLIDHVNDVCAETGRVLTQLREVKHDED